LNSGAENPNAICVVPAAAITVLINDEGLIITVRFIEHAKCSFYS